MIVSAFGRSVLVVKGIISSGCLCLMAVLEWVSECRLLI